MSQQVTRKEFLVRSGLVVVALSGLVSAVKSSGQLMQHGKAKNKGSSYGGGNYGV